MAVRFDCNRGSGTWKSSGPSQIEFSRIFEFEPRVDGSGQPVRYQCGKAEVVTTAEGDARDLSVGGKSFALQRTKSASGARKRQ